MARPLNTHLLACVKAEYLLLTLDRWRSCIITFKDAAYQWARGYNHIWWQETSLACWKLLLNTRVDNWEWVWCSFPCWPHALTLYWNTSSAFHYASNTQAIDLSAPYQYNLPLQANVNTTVVYWLILFQDAVHLIAPSSRVVFHHTKCSNAFKCISFINTSCSWVKAKNSC